MDRENKNTPHYEGKLRVRSCGILIKADQILLINHRGLNGNETFWSLPGGGVMFGESCRSAVVREFKEETNLDIEVESYLFTNEFIGERIHALEIFFSIKHIEGKLEKGIDPELSLDDQIINDVAWITFERLSTIDNTKKHNILHHIESLDILLSKRSFFEFPHNSNK